MAVKRSTKQKISKTIRFFVLLFLVVVFFLPLVSMLVTSLKTMGELYRIPAKLLPDVPQWGNYKQAWEMVNFGKYLVNSLLLTVLYTVPAVMSSCFAGYAFSRFQVKESKGIFLIVLSTLMIPQMVTIMPLYMIMTKIAFVNQRVLWFFWGIQGLPFVIFLFRQFFSTIPLSFEESARMDGAGRFQIFFIIMFPLVQTGVIIASIFAFQWSWSEFLMPVLFLTDEKTSLAVKIAMGYSDQKENVLYNIAMAGIVYYTIPLMVLFFTLQKKFVAGLLAGGLKG
ncbi:MAG TPA: carbohydrate ABC transporter permease [Spirochaetia bacterium]|nr:carbohydrate ABC transporter permease [Spirochaetia bacterium]